LFFIVLGMLHYGLLHSARKACVSCYTEAKQAKSGKGFFMPKVFFCWWNNNKMMIKMMREIGRTLPMVYAKF